MSNQLNKSISLVLSCGASRGLAHIGVIEVLQENGFEIESVSGSSIGAVIGGVYAAGKMNEYKEWISGLSSTDILKLMDFTLPSKGMLKGEKVFQTMKKFMSDINIENLPIPYTAVGTDLRQKKEIIFNKGSLYEAMRASVAIPGVFTPFIVDGREVVDGGILCPLPIDSLYRKQGSLLVASNVNASEEEALVKFKRDKKSKSWTDRLLGSSDDKVKVTTDKLKLIDIYHESISMMSDKITQMAIEKHQPDIVIQIAKNSCSMFEFHLAKELIQLGRDSCTEALDQWKALGIAS